MALTDENGMGTTMLVQPSGFGGNNGFGGGLFGGDLSIIVLFFLFMMMGGWGGGFGGGFGGAGDLYPWMNQSNQFNNGFRDQMLNDNITGIRDSITGGFAGVTQQLYANQIADMQQQFALQSQLAQCCCDNRAATADLKYTVATENCADRTQSLMNTRDIIDSQTRSTQAILDKLCALELDGVKSQLAQAQRDNIGLQNQLNMATMAASQAAQTATFQQGLNDEVDALYNRLKNCPVGTVPVYGSQPIFTCGGNGCGCGMGA